MQATAVLLDLLGAARTRLHFGFILAIVATIFVWWLLNRSSLGFRFRAVGENPNAARVAGIDVKRIYVSRCSSPAPSSASPASTQVLGTMTTGFTAGIDAGIGFDAITVALLGRLDARGACSSRASCSAPSRPAATRCRRPQGVPIDIILVVQSVIVLFIAAPPLVRAIAPFIPKPFGPGDEVVKPAKLGGKKAVVTK